MTFVGIASPAELRLVTRAHILAWRKDLERRELAGATAAINALENGADIAKVQEWLGHADISTTRMCMTGARAGRRIRRPSR